jgi:TM2 domain-containing membrane protein YozV
MQSNPHYAVVYQGQLIENFSQQQVVQNLIDLFKLDLAKAEQLIARSEFTLKRNLSAEKAQAFFTKISNAGLQCVITPPLQQLSSDELQLEPLPASNASSVGAGQTPDSKSASAEYTYDYEKQQQQNSSENPYQAPEIIRSEQQNCFCRQCGKNIQLNAEVCPYCHSSQLDGKPRSKVVAAILGITLGMFGAHRFYLGKWWGIFYLFGGVIAWGIAIIESIIFLATSKETWQRKYGNVRGNAGVIVGAIIGVIIVIGILAAIALPAYQDYTTRAKVSQLLIQMEATKNSIADYALSNSELPYQLSDIDNLPSVDRKLIESLEWRGQRNLILTISKRLSPLLEGETIILMARLNNEQVSWDCSGGTLAAKYRPPVCQEGKMTFQQSRDSTKLVRSLDNSYQFRVPSNWALRSDLNEEADFAYANLIKEEYLITFAHRKDEVSNFTFEDYATYLSEDFRLDNLDIQFMNESELSGLRVLNYEVRGSAQGTELLYKLGFIEGKEHFYYFLFWTLPNKRSSAFPVFEKTLGSFKEN